MTFANEASPASYWESQPMVPMRSFVYPARLTPDRTDGGYVVTFRDIPEAVTQGDTREEGFVEAAGAIQAAIEGRIMDDLEIPAASPPRRGERMIAVPIQTALKAALYLELKESGVSRTELARRLAIDEKEARRMLDPRHPSKADRLERALAVLGRQAEVRVS
jgi:antitoxin HicB